MRSFEALLHRASLSATVRLPQHVHPKYVQELLGHPSIALILDAYSHVLPGMGGGATGAMEDVLG